MAEAGFGPAMVDRWAISPKADSIDGPEYQSGGKA